MGAQANSPFGWEEHSIRAFRPPNHYLLSKLLDYVIVARESLHQLPYSVDEIYGLKNTNRSSTKYPVTLESIRPHIEYMAILNLRMQSPSS